jgi:magnesium transporter
MRVFHSIILSVIVIVIHTHSVIGDTIVKQHRVSSDVNVEHVNVEHVTVTAGHDNVASVSGSVAAGHVLLSESDSINMITSDMIPTSSAATATTPGPAAAAAAAAGAAVVVATTNSSKHTTSSSPSASPLHTNNTNVHKNEKGKDKGKVKAKTPSTTKTVSPSSPNKHTQNATHQAKLNATSRKLQAHQAQPPPPPPPHPHPQPQPQPQPHRTSPAPPVAAPPAAAAGGGTNNKNDKKVKQAQNQQHQKPAPGSVSPPVSAPPVAADPYHPDAAVNWQQQPQAPPAAQTPPAASPTPPAPPTQAPAATPPPSHTSGDAHLQYPVHETQNPYHNGVGHSPATPPAQHVQNSAGLISSLLPPPPGSKQPHQADYHWAIGVVLAAIASVVSNLGLNFQKLTHIQLQDAPEDVRREYFRSKLWMLGLGMIILGSICDFAALAFGAQSIIAPLGSLTLVSNVFFAPCLLGETLTPRDIYATITICCGATVAIIFASHKDTIYGLKQLFGFYEQPRFGLYAIFVMATMGALWSAIQYMERIRRENPKSRQYRELIKYHRFCYAALSGTVGAQSVLFAKCSAELIVNTFIGEGFLLSYYQTWMVFICMGATIFLQIKWMNEGLQRFEALYIVPVFMSFWILISVVAGLVFFGEYAEMNSKQAMMFPFGVMMTIVGVYFLSQRGVDDHENSVEQQIHDKKCSRSHNGTPRDHDGSATPQASPVVTSTGAADQPPPISDHTGLLDASSQLDGPQSQAQPLLQDSSAGTHLHRRFAHQHHRQIRRFDSSVGFMGTSSPAGFIPSRALALSNTMRHDHGRVDEEDYYDSGDDDGGVL